MKVLLYAAIVLAASISVDAFNPVLTRKVFGVSVGGIGENS
jgi:hypothetical protein